VDHLFRHYYRGGNRLVRRGYHAARGEWTEIPPLSVYSKQAWKGGLRTALLLVGPGEIGVIGLYDFINAVEALCAPVLVPVLLGFQ
jgi:hypothetical protein